MGKNKYINKKQCLESGYTKADGFFYKSTVLEKYLSKGWLEFGSKKYSGQDRLKAGARLYSDYKKGHIAGYCASSWSSIVVDCAKMTSGDDMFDVRTRYFGVIRSVPREFWGVIRKVCIEDMELNAGECLSERRRLEITFSLKKDLCRGLDRVIEFYSRR